MKKIYELEYGQMDHEIFLESLEGYDDQLLKIGEVSPKQPFNLKISEGKKFYDIVRYQDVFNFAISKKVFNILKDNAITGWKFYETVINKSNEAYFGFQVTGRCGKLNKPKESGFYVGRKFDEGLWDGSDFFCPEGTMLVFCTEKVKTLFEKNKISNVKFVDINEVEWFNT